MTQSVLIQGLRVIEPFHSYEELIPKRIKSGNVVIRFWDLALREHARYNKAGVYDEPLSSFFRNVDTSSGNITEHPLGDGKTKIHTLKARAVLVDMEESVVGGLLKGPLGELFDNRQLITDVSGSGNNWVVGNKTYGSKYHDQIVDTVRRSAESCDHLQSFFMMHSMGGGTGSGVGTRILEILRDEYPDVYRFSVVVYPSEKDDVITSPYNCVLAHRELTENADCVLPIENKALSDICAKAVASQSKHTSCSKHCSSVTKDKPFDEMNNIVANLLLGLTSASRFEGSLNVDLNEITMNLVPFPRLHYLVSSLLPLYSVKDVGLPLHRLDQSFSDAFLPEHQLIKANPKQGLYLACALLLRGQVNISDIRRNIERLRPSLRFVHWNQDGWKTGLCSVPPLGLPYSLLTLSNNTCIRHTFCDIKERFNLLYRRKAHLHHFLSVEGVEAELFTECGESLTSLIQQYSSLETQHAQQSVARLKVN